MTTRAYRHLLCPRRINQLALRNRMFFTPNGFSLAGDDHTMADTVIVAMGHPHWNSDLR